MAYTGTRNFVENATDMGANPTIAKNPDSTTTPELPNTSTQLGTTMWGSNGSAYVYCVANGTINQDDFVVVLGIGDGFSLNFTASSITGANSRSKIGAWVGKADCAATTGQYLWVQRLGVGVAGNYGTISGSYTTLHSTTTAGSLSTSSVAGTTSAIAGIVTNGGVSSGGTQCLLSYGYVSAND